MSTDPHTERWRPKVGDPYKGIVQARNRAVRRCWRAARATLAAHTEEIARCSYERATLDRRALEGEMDVEKFARLARRIARPVV